MQVFAMCDQLCSGNTKDTADHSYCDCPEESYDEETDLALALLPKCT